MLQFGETMACCAGSVTCMLAPQPSGSLALLLLLPFSQPNARTAAVLVDEFDACGFQRRPNLLRGAFATAEFANHRFKASNSWL